MGVFASLRSTNTGDHTGILLVWQFPCQVPTTGPMNEESEAPAGSGVRPVGLTLPSRQHQPSVASLHQKAAAACLCQPEQSRFVVSTWEDVEKGGGGKGSAWSTRNPDLGSKSVQPTLVSSDLYQRPILSLADWLLNGPQTVNILCMVGHRLPVAPCNFLLLCQPKTWSFLIFTPARLPVRLVKFMERSVKTCPQAPTFPWEAHPSDLWSSWSGFWDALLGCPPVLRGGGAGGGAAWPGWVVAASGRHLERRDPGIACWQSWINHPAEARSGGCGGLLGAFPSNSSRGPVEPCGGGMAVMEAHPLACWSSGHRHHLQPEQRTLPHAHFTWLKLGFPLKLNSCHPGALGSSANVAAWISPPYWET